MYEEFETVDDVLAHFGVKGMRWGVRRQDFQARKQARISRGDELNKKKAPKTRSLVRNGSAGTAGWLSGAAAYTAGLIATSPVVLQYGAVTVVGTTAPAWAGPLAAVGATAAASSLAISGYKTVSELRASSASNKAALKRARN